MRLFAKIAELIRGRRQQQAQQTKRAHLLSLYMGEANGVEGPDRAFRPNRQRQHSREAHRDDHRAVQPRPKASPYKGISKPNAPRGLAPVLTDIDRAAPLVRARLQEAHRATFGAYQH